MLYEGPHRLPMGFFLLYGLIIKEEISMFKINRYRYIDKDSGLSFVIYARHIDTAYKIVELVNNTYGYKLHKKRMFFVKQIYVDVPPYELEQMQLDSLVNKQ